MPSHRSTQAIRISLGLIAACILKLGPDGVLPFIYFQF